MGKHAKPEEIVAKLRQFEVLTAQGKSIAEAARSIGVSEQTYYRWRADYGSMKMDQVRRLKELETENTRLRRAVSDLTLNLEVFYSLREAEVLIEAWRRHFNTVRPHSSLGYLPPAPEAILPRSGTVAPWPGAPAMESARPANPDVAPKPTLH